MGKRRAMGSLEAEVLGVLWRADAARTPGHVLDELGDGLAYTTVMTILTRLWQKGLVERIKQGRAYAYRPVVSEAELVASRMRDELSRSSDHLEAMSHFVDGLDPEEAEALRRLLRGSDDR